MSQLKKRARLVGGGLILILLVIFLAACTGPQGSPGPAGPQGAPGTTGAAAPVPSGPDLKATITKVTIGADGKVTVAYTLTDDNGTPVKRSELDADSEGFSIARIEVDSKSGLTQWLSYVVGDVKGAPYTFKGKEVQPALAAVKGKPLIAADQGGEFKEVAPGQYTYTLKTVLPENYDKNATHRVFYQGTREGQHYAANDTFDFVPAGGEVKVTRQLVAIESCNQCHNPLGVTLHGGTRRDTKACVVCHTSQNVDPETGNTAEFKVLVHKIHRGVNLPSAQNGTDYVIVGFNQAVFNLSKIGWPQNILNCTTCHGGAPVGMKAEDWAKIVPPQADNWKTAPSAAACGACHDNIDFATGKARYGGRDHPEAGPQKDDTNCASCHEADSGQEFDASVVGAHVIPVNSKQLKGVNFTLEKAVATAGMQPQVTFAIKDNAGKFLNPNDFNSLAIILGHPTTDYAHRIEETVNSKPTPPATFTRAGVLTPVGDGRYVYTFAATINSTWTGSVGIGINGYINATIKGNEGKDVVVREANVNPVIYASLDVGKAAVPRRTVVKRENCNQCHLNLGSPAGFSLHGGTRFSTEFCLLCHNANLTDEGRRLARRPPGEMPPESMQYKFLIHSIHAGAEREVATTFGTRTLTSETFFPGTLKNCATCHEGPSYTIPLPAGVLPTTVTQTGKGVVSVTQPITAACAACHIDRASFDAHADTMTSATKGEACANCHGRGKDFDVEKMHQR